MIRLHNEVSVRHLISVQASQQTLIVNHYELNFQWLFYHNHLSIYAKHRTSGSIQAAL